MNVVYLEIDDATNADPSAGVPTSPGMASANPDLKAIFIDHGNLTSTIPTYMKAAGLAPGQRLRRGLRPVAGDGPGRQGWLCGPGHRPAAVPAGLRGIAQLCLSHQFGFSGLFINTGGGFVDKSNIDVIAPLVEQQIR